MAKRTFECELSTKSIDNLIKELNRYKNNELQRKIDIFTRRLAQEGVEAARVHVARYDAIFTGELIASIDTQFGHSGNGECVFYVKCDNEHAAFVEFGTGFAGKFSPYPYPLPNGMSWQYLTGKQLITNIGKGIYGWFYKGDDGNVYFTEGMPARPFMHEAYIDVFMQVEEIAKEVFGYVR